MQRRDIWKSIIAKKQQHQSLNEFMNSLTDAEFTEFIQTKDIPFEKLAETGRQKEEFGINPKELMLESKENVLLEQSKMFSQ